MSQPSKSLDEVYTLSKLFKCNEIKLSAWNNKQQLLVLYVGDGNFIYYNLTEEEPIMKLVPWFNDPLHTPISIDFSPSGTFLLILSKSCHLYILPVLPVLNSSFKTELNFFTNDLTIHTYPFSLKTSKKKQRTKSPNSSLGIISSLSLQSSSLNSSSNDKQKSSNSGSTSFQESQGNENVMKLKESLSTKCEASPSVVCWWQSLQNSQEVGVIGTKSGDILFIDLVTGLKIGETSVKGEVKSLSVCQDSAADNVFLLITVGNNEQYKLILEQRSLNYVWCGKQNSNGVDDSDATAGNGNYLPSARARLQGLKQMSAEKLASLKHKIAETRSKIGPKQGPNEEVSQGKPQGPPPESLGSFIGETLISLQHSHEKNVLAGYYSKWQLYTIHSMNLDFVPLFIHKMPAETEELLLCDRVIFVVSNNRTSIQVVSSKLTETWIEQNDDFNPDSVLGKWHLKELDEEEENSSDSAKTEETSPKPDLIPDDEIGRRERILSVYRSEGKVEEYNVAKAYNLEKTEEELPETPKAENCVVVTDRSVFVLEMKSNMVKAALDLILETHELEKAERICTVFGINLQKLLELAGDVKLAAREFPTAIALYKLSKCGLLKSIVKLACENHCSQVLNYSTVLMANSLSDMSLTERIHLSNLILMAYTQQILKNENNRSLLEKFLDFLEKNSYFDEVLAVSVTGQSLLFPCLHKLIARKGLILDGYCVLIKLMERFAKSRVLEWSLNKKEFWKCATQVDLAEALVVRASSFSTFADYVSRHVDELDVECLGRLLRMLDPTAASLRPVARTFRKEDSFDNDDTQTVFPFGKLVELFVTVLLAKLQKERDGREDYEREFLLPSPDVLEGGDSFSASKENESFGSRETLGEEIWPIRKEIQGDGDKFNGRLETVLSCGYGHSALIRNGSVYTWGQTAKGCLGHGPTMSRYSSPSPIPWFSSFKLEVSVVACGKFHTAALTNNGVYAWGCSRYGQLGLGEVQESPHPRLVSHLAKEKVVAVACGQFHTLALTNQGSVYAWGWGVHGQLGVGRIDDQRLPKHVDALKEHCIVEVAAGHGHSLALSDKGRVYSFGSSVFGQLGTGTTLKNSLPVPVKGINGKVASIATGYFHNLALTESNAVYVWGSSPQCLRFQAQARKRMRLLQSQNADGESSKPGGNEEGGEGVPEGGGLLDKAESESHLSPSLVDTSNVLGKIIQISCGCHHSALVTDSGSLYTWGRSIDGQLGNGGHREVAAPSLVSADLKVDCVACGCEFTAAQEKHTGRLFCWGSNSVGQLAVPVKESATKSLDGKLIMLKSCKRIVRLLDRNAASNSVDVPREVSEIPPPTFTYHTLSKHLASSPRDLSRFDPEYSLRSLHFVIERFFDRINLPFIFKKTLEYGNFQAASKISLLQNKCKQSIVYQLKALQSVAKYHQKSASYLETGTEEKSLPQPEIHLFTVQGGREDMCDEGDAPKVSPEDRGDRIVAGRDEEGIGPEEDATSRLKEEYLNHAKYILEVYLSLNASQMYEDFDNCAILETAIQFWTAEKLPMASLESFLTGKMDEIFYDFGYLLFCTPQKENQAPALERFSSAFLLAVTSKILSRIEKNEGCVEYLETMSKLLTNEDAADKSVLAKKKRVPKRKKPRSETYLEAIRENLRRANENFVRISYGDVIGDSVYFFSCGHHHSPESLAEDCRVLREIPDEGAASKLVAFYEELREENHGDLACPSCVRNYLRQ